MGGNGTFAAGRIVAYRWETVGEIHGVKVLELKDKGVSRKLPEEAHSSRMYIMNYPEGHFAQLRVYDRRHRLRLEIAFHPERSVDKSGKPVLHYHVYGQPGFKHGQAQKLSRKAFRRYAKFMKGMVEP
ncbi:MAG: hypothetical protein IJR99_03880 [Kiritimatiellae bacterium]|nr:hypothetical protein [Kiritimatiellia bacterium]